MKYTFYNPKYFRPEELVPPECITLWYRFCDGSMLRVLDRLRNMFGRITINNYAWGGNIRYAGFRPPLCDVGEEDSQHRFGRAFDLKFRDETNLEKIKDYIISDCPEVTVIRIYSWGIHIDNRNANTNEPVIWQHNQ